MNSSYSLIVKPVYNPLFNFLLYRQKLFQLKFIKKLHDNEIKRKTIYFEYFLFHHS